MHAKLGSYLTRNLEELPSGHVSPVMHLLSGGLATWEMGPRSFDRYWKEFRLTLRALRQPDGLYTAVPTEETEALRSNSDRICGPAWVTASYVLLQGIPRGHLRVLLRGEEPITPPDQATLPDEPDEEPGVTPDWPFDDVEDQEE
jgi:hypothetical protein